MAVPPLRSLLYAVRPFRRTRLLERDNGTPGAVLLKSDEVRLLADYLEEPTQHSYWRLTAVWDYGGNFSQFIYEQLGPKFLASEEIAANRAKTLLGSGGLNPDQEQFVNNAFTRLSTLLELFALVREELKSVDGLYDSIQAVQGKDQAQFTDVLPIVRDLVTTIKADRKYFSQRIEDLHRRDQRVSVFPLVIRENINELTRYRNAASHKTRVPLGNYEALRALYCLASLVMWWKKTRESIPWEDERISIIRAAITKAAK